MKKFSIGLLLMLFFCLSASGCSSPHSKDGEKVTYQMYYINEEENLVIAKDYTPESSNTIDMIEEFTEKQSEKIDSKEYQSILPEGVTIDNSVMNKGMLSLNMSEGYGDIELSREILSRVGLVRTFGQIPGVARVQILVKGQPLKDSQGKEVGAMTADSFVENSGKEINTYQNIGMTLYFTDESGKMLVPEERNVYYSSNVPLERVVVEQLIKGPKVDGHFATLASETRILSATISDDICYVNFDQSFQTLNLDVSEEIPIYSIVNSLVSVCKVREVQFSINGESKVTYKENVGLDQLFQWNQDIIQTEE